MNNLFSVLSLMTNAAVAGWLVVMVASRYSPRAAETREMLVQSLAGPALLYAALISLAATLGSLYYSEIAHFEACKLCWYQRIAMYPIWVILGIGYFRGDGASRLYAYPLAAVGAVIAAYHYLLHHFPDLSTGGCLEAVPCTAPWVWRFGFISIPYMALSAFTLILVLLWASSLAAPSEEETPRAEVMA